MKKALIVASTAGFIRGFLLHDIQLLQRMGYEVHCAANTKATVTFKAEELFPAMGAAFHQIDFPPSSPLSKATLEAYRQFRQLLSEHSFAVIHCHTPIVGVIVRVAAMGLRRHGCKVLYTTHGLTFPKGSPFKDKLIYGTAEWFGARLSDGIITINREDYGTMKRFGCKKVFYINGVGVDTKRFHSVEIDRSEYRKSIGVSDDDIMVLAVGELTARKNHQVLIKALSELKDDSYVLVVCGRAFSGTGTYDHLDALAKELGVRVQFLGFRQDIPAICHCADIAAIPSLREGLGLAGVEALASGVPVVGSAVQGIKDYVVDGKTGFLCDPKDAKQFAQNIQQLSDPAVREMMRPLCIEKAEEFRAEISHRQMEAIYREVLGDRF